MVAYLIPLIGGVSNKLLRGGGLDIPLGKPLFLLVTLGCAFYVYRNWKALSATLGMLLGMMTGWGGYIGAIAGNAKDPEVKIIDWMIQGIDNPVLWGVVGLTLRGLMWGACLSIATLNPLFLALSASMGAIYWLSYQIIPIDKSYDLGFMPLTGWGLGEILFGIILFSGLVWRNEKA